MQTYKPISPRVIKVDFKNLNIEMRKRYEEVVRQWWMKREGGEERPVCPRCGRKAAKNGTYWTKNGERRQHYRCTRCKISVSVERLMPTYRGRYGKSIIVLVVELVMDGDGHTSQECLNAS